MPSLREKMVIQRFDELLHGGVVNQAPVRYPSHEVGATRGCIITCNRDHVITKSRVIIAGNYNSHKSCLYCHAFRLHES